MPDLTISQKTQLLEALQFEESNRFQYHVSQAINRAVMLSDTSDELLQMLKSGSLLFEAAMGVVREELKLPPKGNIGFVSLSEQL